MISDVRQGSLDVQKGQPPSMRAIDPSAATVNLGTHLVNTNSVPLNLGGIDSFIQTSMFAKNESTRK